MTLMTALSLGVMGAELTIGFDGTEDVKFGTPLSEIPIRPDPVSRVREIYGREIKDEPDFHDDRERYLTISSGDGKHAIRFMTSDGKVSAMIAGTAKSVQYVEGCL